jgi:1-aminocyclopropane-1-carboxylate deaminase/D-cysteine desulfhydrase-like pyridoxal-dependent ACC family enzyme
MNPTHHELTPVQDFGNWWAKREDLACNIGPLHPSGSKVRQYTAMAAKSPPGTPMVVGCSAHSAQQIYVADAAERSGVKAYVFVPAREHTTKATLWAADHGAEVIAVRPGYPSVYRNQAKAKAKELGGCIRWDVEVAVIDSAYQATNIPTNTGRIIVPTGSGLTAAGVLAGLAHLGRKDVSVLAVAVSAMASYEHIMETAARFTTHELPWLEVVRHPMPYEVPLYPKTPFDDTWLDPYYAAKALSYVQPGDCLWVSGRRPTNL